MPGSRDRAGIAIEDANIEGADIDGVVIVPHADVKRVASAALAREAKEASNRKRLVAGELGLEMYGMREPLSKAGLRYFADEVAFKKTLS